MTLETLDGLSDDARPSRAGSLRLDQARATSSSGHDRRSYTTAGDTTARCGSRSATSRTGSVAPTESGERRPQRRSHEKATSVDRLIARRGSRRQVSILWVGDIYRGLRHEANSRTVFLTKTGLLSRERAEQVVLQRFGHWTYAIAPVAEPGTDCPAHCRKPLSSSSILAARSRTLSSARGSVTPGWARPSALPLNQRGLEASEDTPMAGSRTPVLGFGQVAGGNEHRWNPQRLADLAGSINSVSLSI